MAESPFLAFAESHDLDYAERVADGAAGKFPLRQGETTELVGGTLPGAYDGLVARLRRKVDESESPTEFTMVVTRIPESVAFARFIACFEAGFRGVVSRAIGAGGLGWIREFTFESIEFNRRYRIAMLRTGQENRLRQLFSPVFLDWMANTAPEGLYFDLISGVLTVTFDGGSVSTAADVGRACELAGKIAERIRSEALEGTLGDGHDPNAEAAWAAAETRLAGQIQRAGFRQPPSEVRSALKPIGRAIKVDKGLFGRLFGSSESTEAKVVALTAVLLSYGDRAGLETRHPEALYELFPFFDHFPMALMRQLSLHGTLPGTNASEALVAFADLESMGSGERLGYRPAIEIESLPDHNGLLHVLPRGGREDPFPSVIGGFSVSLAAGAERVTDITRRERAEAAALAESLGGRFDVVSHGSPGAAVVGEAARAWLANGTGDALVLEGGKLTLVGAVRPAIEWSFGTLDEFRGSVAPVIPEVPAISAG